MADRRVYVRSAACAMGVTAGTARPPNASTATGMVREMQRSEQGRSPLALRLNLHEGEDSRAASLKRLSAAPHPANRRRMFVKGGSQDITSHTTIASSAVGPPHVGWPPSVSVFSSSWPCVSQLRPSCSCSESDRLYGLHLGGLSIDLRAANEATIQPQ